MVSWEQLNQRITNCHRCPRLISYCREVGATKRRAFQHESYWAKPVPNFGDPRARMLIVGLAPAAHGANRTGRMFTGDRSGDWLFRALHRAGFATQAKATDRDDGLTLVDCAITAACHCAPPANRPLREELQECRVWLDHTFEILRPRVIVALGQIGWNTVFDFLKSQGEFAGARPRFGHGIRRKIDSDRVVLASYHPSQQNTFTGRLTESMLDKVFEMARRELDDVQNRMGDV